ncbi:CHAP domain-containing protein [Chryseobacterium lathyri]|nr:CHAP domain-containing protein [Chryseobacterium lathyri]
MKLSIKALEVAVSQLGKQESPPGSNWGEPVKTYLSSVGITFPAPWCMAFVYWCYELASNQLNLNNTAIKTGGVLAAWNKVTQNIKSSTPQIGSVFIMDFGKGQGHTGLVENFDNQFIYTIEGNTNDTGSREGFKVSRRKRPRSTIKGYLNY